MELRVLNYFLAIAREQSIVRAAETLHLSQPTLSTQIKGLEEELGKQLLIRGTKGSRKITLTEEGMILRKRAEEILDLVRETENEITMSDDIIMGFVLLPKPLRRCRVNIQGSTIISPAETQPMYLNIWTRVLSTSASCSAMLI